MKPADIRAMTIDQIDDEVLKLKKEHFNLRFQRASGQLENTARVREVLVDDDVARSKRITLDDWRRRSLAEKVLERIAALLDPQL